MKRLEDTKEKKKKKVNDISSTFKNRFFNPCIIPTQVICSFSFYTLLFSKYTIFYFFCVLYSNPKDNKKLRDRKIYISLVKP